MKLRLAIVALIGLLIVLVVLLIITPRFRDNKLLYMSSVVKTRAVTANSLYNMKYHEIGEINDSNFSALEKAIIADELWESTTSDYEKTTKQKIIHENGHLGYEIHWLGLDERKRITRCLYLGDGSYSVEHYIEHKIR